MKWDAIYERQYLVNVELYSIFTMKNFTYIEHNNEQLTIIF